MSNSKRQEKTIKPSYKNSLQIKKIRVVANYKEAPCSSRCNVSRFSSSKEVCDDDEEEFYYTEVELGLTSPPPTLSHRDMARPFHEDPDYQRLLVGNMRQSLLAQAAANAGIGSMPPQSPHKLLKLSPR
nr:unnamed protein product [Callosobruchus analis]